MWMQWMISFRGKIEHVSHNIHCLRKSKSEQIIQAWKSAQLEETRFAPMKYLSVVCYFYWRHKVNWPFLRFNLLFFKIPLQQQSNLFSTFRINSNNSFIQLKSKATLPLNITCEHILQKAKPPNKVLHKATPPIIVN